MDWANDDEDSIYVTPEPLAQVASTSAGGRPTARMHTTRVSKARKSLGYRNRGTAPRPRPPSSHRQSLTEATVPDWIGGPMVGNCPPFNANSGWMPDPANQRVYTYGGLAPGDRSEIPTSDFYVCDTTTMEWKNITNSLRFRDPYNPFSREPRHQKAIPLPQLTEPGCTIITINSSSFIFIFGGYEIETDTVSSKIIVIDLDNLEWWYLQLEGGDVEARIEPAVVAVDAKLYIFGGYRELDHRDPQPFYSYSVAEFLQDQRWHWTVRDEPYSHIVPQGHLFGKAIAVYNGAKLLLTPGRVSGNYVQFEEDSLFYYHVAKKTFQQAYITGDFPTDVLWYGIVPTTAPPTTRISSPVKRGSPRKALSSSPSTSITASVAQFIASTPSSPSLIICAWIPIRGGYAAPELWQLFLTPDERIDRLNIAQRVLEFNNDYQWFVCVDGKMRLMGYDDGRASAEASDPDPNAKWNTFLDIPMPNGN